MRTGWCRHFWRVARATADSLTRSVRNQTNSWRGSEQVCAVFFQHSFLDRKKLDIQKHRTYIIGEREGCAKARYHHERSQSTREITPGIRTGMEMSKPAAWDVTSRSGPQRDVMTGVGPILQIEIVANRTDMRRERFYSKPRFRKAKSPGADRRGILGLGTGFMDVSHVVLGVPTAQPNCVATQRVHTESQYSPVSTRCVDICEGNSVSYGIAKGVKRYE